MKYIYLPFLILFHLTCFSQEWQWANKMETVTGDYDHLLVNDNSGNIYCFANFSGDSATIGDINIQNTNENTGDAYFVKYNSDGEFLWLKQIGGEGTDDIYSITCDLEGNVLVAGIYRWYGITFGNEFFPGTGMFLAKYNTEGDLLWVKTGSGAYVYDMEISSTGEIYIGGTFGTSFNFGGVSIIGEENSSHIYIAKLTANGDALWIKNATGPVEDFHGNLLTSIAVDYEGNVITTGWFRTNPTTFDTLIFENNSWASYYVVKYDNNGNVLWGKTAGNYSCVTNPRGLVVDTQGNIYISGTSCNDVAFGDFTIDTTAGSKYFIVKYSPNGTEQWIRTTSGGYSSISGSIIDSNGDVYVSGTYSPPIELGNNVGLYTDYNAMFIAKYNKDGTPEWITGSSSADLNTKVSMSISNDNSLYAAGYIPYGNLTLGNIELQNTQNEYLIFLAKMSMSELSVPDTIKPIFSIYPNPFSDLINIITTDNILNIRIIETNGRKLEEVHGVSSINLSNLSKGMYFMTITTLTGEYSEKIIKD